MRPHRVDGRCLIGEHAPDDLDPAGPELVGATACLGGRVGLGEDDSANAGRQKRLRAGPGTAHMPAGLKRDDCGCSPC